MFNNYINIYDLQRAFEKIKQGELSKILSAIIPLNKSEKIRSAWKHHISPPKNWWDIPQVQKRWNYLVTGNPEITIYNYTAQKFLSAKNLSALSLCCGTGHNEINWAKTEVFSNICAFDLSPDRIAEANQSAKKENLDSILSFKVDDAVNLELEDKHFDVIIADGALHHLTPLHDIVKKFSYSLKKDGLLILKEFVGASRFQWSDAQLNYVAELLSMLPDKYKKRWKSKSIKNKHYRPSRLSMILSDPSEAVESSNILPVLNNHLELIELKPMGGCILQLAFNDIAHNFINSDEETSKWINTCFDFEDSLLNSNKLESDFVFAVYKKR